MAILKVMVLKFLKKILVNNFYQLYFPRRAFNLSEEKSKKQVLFVHLMEQKVNKLKILMNPNNKSARELLKSLNKPGYEVSIKNRNGIIIRIDKKNVPMSLNDRINPENL